ncbi:MAG: ferrous iron transport protein A [Clostridiales bacterium]|nr:ferrous iron transport protein A [Clostridiales bacterium]
MSNSLQKQSTNNLTTATLDNVSVGSTCVIDGCNLPNSTKNRLEEMGLTKGCEVTVLKIAPLGDPMEIRVRGYSLCIRKETARQFSVTATKATSV